MLLPMMWWKLSAASSGDKDASVKNRDIVAKLMTPDANRRRTETCFRECVRKKYKGWLRRPPLMTPVPNTGVSANCLHNCLCWLLSLIWECPLRNPFCLLSHLTQSSAERMNAGPS